MGKTAGRETAMRNGAALAFALILAGCGAFREEAPLDSYTAEELFKQGELKLEEGGRPDDAIRFFQEVERLYPIPNTPAAR